MYELIMAILTSIPIAVAMLGAWFLVGRSGRQERCRRTFFEGLEEGGNQGRKLGRKEALAEVEEMREEKNVGYREAALIIQKKCALCGKKCLHCAKHKKAKAKKVRTSPVPGRYTVAAETEREEHWIETVAKTRMAQDRGKG